MTIRTPRYPLTLVAALLLLAFWLFCVWVLYVSGVLFKWLSLIGLSLLLVVVFKAVVIVRAVEDYDARPSIWVRLYSFGFRVLNLMVDWHRLPRYLGSLNLLAMRFDLRQKNLYDVPLPRQDAPEWDPKYRVHRTPDGTFNDLSQPRMGSCNVQFGRNFPLEKCRPEVEPELLRPSPREISRRLLARDQFIPATSLNLLAAAWIQFMNHGWFAHRRSKTRFIEIPLGPSDQWHQSPMRFERTEAATRSDGVDDSVPRFENTETHWWDAAQIYGSSNELQGKLRAGFDGKLKILDNGLLPLEDDPDLFGIDLTGFSDVWWVGMSMLHTLFAREHNLICDRLKAEYHWTDDEDLFQTARLINAALITKIHTVEWTPGILGHPTLQTSMIGNWSGLLGENIRTALGRLSPSESISGIPGSPQEHHAAPYSLTEEFVAVYRLHPLIPDDYTFRRLKDHSVITEKTFDEIQANNTRKVVELFVNDDLSLADLFYSFGVAHPGALCLHNYPESLRNLATIKRGKIDLATIDIFRDRERGVPRYNEFRSMLRKPRVKSFHKLTDNPRWAKEIEEVYEGDIDKVDLMVGLYSEPLPRGFGFSDTAFRIFILMASRRIKSDRFYTTDYRPELYTELGINWVNDNTMRTVLLRHFPQLGPALFRSENAFAPWSRVK